eukprot:3687320-Amphidinium_carterae.1
MRPLARPPRPLAHLAGGGIHLSTEAELDDIIKCRNSGSSSTQRASERFSNSLPIPVQKP